MMENTAAIKTRQDELRAFLNRPLTNLCGFEPFYLDETPTVPCDRCDSMIKEHSIHSVANFSICTECLEICVKEGCSREKEKHV